MIIDREISPTEFCFRALQVDIRVSLLNLLFGGGGDRVVSVTQAAEDMKNESHILVDVRELDEWRDGHIDGAIHIPLGELLKRTSELPADRAVYAICHSGSRSLYAVNVLEGAGREGSRSVAGGMISWQRAGFPVVR